MDRQLLKRLQCVLDHQEIRIRKRLELRKQLAHYKIAYPQFIEFFYISVSIVGLCLEGKEETLFRKRKPATVCQQDTNGSVL